MHENKITVRLQIGNHEVKEQFSEIISSVNGYRLVNGSGPANCDLLIMEIGNNVSEEFNYVQSLKESGLISEFILTSPRTEPEILIQALRAGAKEFFTQPVAGEEISSSLIKIHDRLENAKASQKPKKDGIIINVIGSKGGVGTTTVAVNLAATLNELNGDKSVALIDMNMLFGEIPLFLDIHSTFSWGEIARNISRLDATYLMSVLAKHSSGVHILPSPTDLNGVHYADPDIIAQILGIMKNEFDYIVVDNGQSLDNMSQKIFQMSDMVYVVSILSLPCLINVKRLLETFNYMGYPSEEKVKIIMNRVHKKSVLSVKEAEESISREISWLIPNDYNSTMSAINQGKMLVDVSEHAEITNSFRKLARTFNEKKEEKPVKAKAGFWMNLFA